MQPITIHSGIAAPLDRANVDTDMIIPKQFLRKTEKTGFGKNLFHEMRYLDLEGIKENPDFVLNKPAFKNASILLAQENFGCGSSREHAPWALLDFGFRVIIAPSFADIFYNNCAQNGILLIRLKKDETKALFEEINKAPGSKITADLKEQKVFSPSGKEHKFEIEPFIKECLIKGLDHIGWTLQFKDKIDSFEKKLKKEKPWLS
ncbi:MAG: 3-isopropylmalate dehydratase small subunit [Candidatus Omnitrophica bacterium]|nr:3-isopropylmalate dehydratase small subunit [Candidatus Omnitrophota bacterium]